MVDTRVMNFSAGPSALPEEVLERVGHELLNWRETGRSVMEVSHRSKEYGEVHESARSLFKELMGMGDEWEVLFLQGGATMQFAMAPMNLLQENGSADYVLTGTWSRKALDAARAVGRARCAADAAEKDGFYRRTLSDGELDLDRRAVYCHLTTNNTIYGTQWRDLPDTGDVPMVLDFSSDIMSRDLDLEKVGLLYAGAQKNLGPSGVCVVALRKGMLERCRRDLAPILSYRAHASKGSLLNTPPTFNVYVLSLVLEWVRDNGGIQEMERRALEKSRALYGVLDASEGFYVCPVEPGHRSMMNAVFRLSHDDLEPTLIADAEQAGFVGIKGHRSVGGLRVSMYNAVQVEHVKELASFLADFARRKG